MSKEVLLDICTEYFLVTNLHDNSVIGQGVENALSATEMELEKKLVFKILQVTSASDFEVINYEVTNAKDKKVGGVSYIVSLIIKFLK